MIPERHPDIAALLEDAARWQPEQPAPSRLEATALERLEARTAPRPRRRRWLSPSLALAPSLAGAVVLGLWWGSRPEPLPTTAAPGPEVATTDRSLAEASAPVDPPAPPAPDGLAGAAGSGRAPATSPRLAAVAAPPRARGARRTARIRPALRIHARIWAEETVTRPVTIIRQPGLLVVGDGSGEVFGYGPAFLEHAIVGRPDEERPETYSSVIPIGAR